MQTFLLLFIFEDGNYLAGQGLESAAFGCVDDGG